MAEERQDDRLMMFCLNSIGLVYRNQGNFKKADDFITRSLKISQKVGSQRWMALNISVLGDICSQQRDYNCAVTQYEKSLTLHKALSDTKGLCITYNKIGKIFLQSNELETALHNFEKSHSIALDLGMRSFLAYTSANIGKIHGKVRQWNKALERTDEAIGILREVGTLDPLRDCYYMKGIFLEHTGNVTGAERNYKESIKILESLREDLTGGEEAMVVFVEKRGKVYKRLIRLFLQQGKIAEALEYLERSRLKKLRDQFDQLKPRLKSQEEKKAREKDFSLREEIQTLRDQLTDEKSQPESKQNKERIVTLERTLGTKRQTYIEYINDLREKFPELASILSIQPDILLDLH